MGMLCASTRHTATAPCALTITVCDKELSVYLVCQRNRAVACLAPHRDIITCYNKILLWGYKTSSFAYNNAPKHVTLLCRVVYDYLANELYRFQLIATSWTQLALLLTSIVQRSAPLPPCQLHIKLTMIYFLQAGAYLLATLLRLQSPCKKNVSSH